MQIAVGGQEGSAAACAWQRECDDLPPCNSVASSLNSPAMAGSGILLRARVAGLLLALFALTFKATLPPGFMLDANAGRMLVVLCGGGEAYFDPGAGQISHPDDQAPADDDSSPPCPFALACATALATPGFVTLTPTFAYVGVSAPACAPVGADDATGPPLPARGPPLHA